MILVSLIVSKVLVVPFVIHYGEVVAPGVHDFIEEEEHDEGPGVEVADGELSDEEIGDSVT